MARVYSRPVDLQALQQFPLLQEQLWAEAKVSGGMVTTIDPADIPDAAVTLALNGKVDYDKIGRRNAYTYIPVLDSDGAPGLKLATWKQNTGAIYLVRLRPAGPRYTDNVSWFAPTGTALLGAATDRFDYTIAQDLFIFTNNGVDFIQRLRSDTNSFAQLGNAPKARFVTAFYNRIIAANYTDPAVGTPVTIGWSGDLNPTVWDPLTDPTAGVSPLIESPSDITDYITRVIGFTNLLVVLREHSIWLGTKQPIGTNPFYFFGAVAGIGCNCPYSVAVMPNGLVWVDLLTGSVWAYQVGGQPERIGLPIEKMLIAGISDPTQVFGSFNFTANKYTCGVVQAGTNVRRLWTYNFTSKAWAFEELPDIYDVYDAFDQIVSKLTVAQLVGTVAQLQGTVANLSPTKVTNVTRLISKADGTISQEDPTSDVDSFGPYTTEIRSKDFVFPDIDTYLSQIKVEYIAHKTGQITIGYSRDTGQTWTNVKTVTINAIEKPQLVRFKKNVKTRRVMWRLIASNGLWEVLSYEVRVFPGAESRK
jgi:hypothetical protein